MSISPRMFSCEVCGGIFPVDTFAFHNCEETKKKIAEEKAIVENWLKSNTPLNPKKDNDPPKQQQKIKNHKKAHQAS